MTVAVYSRNRHLHVEHGRRPNADECWATLGVPPHATREGIASAVVELSGRSRESFLIDLLCASALDTTD
jgi:hypothetical protein